MTSRVKSFKWFNKILISNKTFPPAINFNTKAIKWRFKREIMPEGRVGVEANMPRRYQWQIIPPRTTFTADSLDFINFDEQQKLMEN